VRESALDPVHIDNAIADSYIELGAWLKAPYVYAANAGTIAAGAEDFDLPTTAVLVSTVEHGGDIRIQLASDGLYLQKMTREEIERLRAGNTSASGGGKPYAWAPYEDASTVVKCVCYPRSTAAEAYNRQCERSTWSMTVRIRWPHRAACIGSGASRGGSDLFRNRSPRAG
jgi:hypothetical protein